MDDVGAVRHQSVVRDKMARRVDCRLAVSSGKCDDKIAMLLGRIIWREEQTPVRHACKGLDRPFKVTGILDGASHDFDPERRRNAIGRAQKMAVRKSFGVSDES